MFRETPAAKESKLRTMSPFARAVGIAGWSAVLLALCAQSAPAHAPELRTFDRLPPAIRMQILSGAPRSTAQISDSPFGTHTTICAEGGPSEYVDRAPRMLSDAGYKWVVEYLALPRGPGHRLAKPDDPDWKSLSPRCLDYVRRLHGLGFNVLMRLDAVPAAKLTGASPLDDDDLKLAAAFAQRAVAQLKPYVRHWQIGNEPNTGNAPLTYVKVAETVSRAIRSEQRDAVVYGPAVAMLQCLAEEPFPWIRGAIDAGLLTHIDAFSFHPYRANGDTPEQASEFAKWRHWQSYYAQVANLSDTLRAGRSGKPVPLATTEDGESSAVSASGEQRVTWTIDAKNELRRSLQDFWLGIYPRTHFAFFRDIDDAFYNVEGSFNAITKGFERKPIYYAAQNLHAVLDRTYQRVDDIAVVITPLSSSAPPADALGKLGIYAQTYAKQHAGFRELLVFFWSTAPATDVHLRVPVRVEVQSSGWEAPLLLDLMTMPGKALIVGHEPSKHVRSRSLVAHRTAGGVAIDDIELRDYPQLLKLVRLTQPRRKP